MKFFLVRFEPQLSQPVHSLSLDCIYIIAHSTVDCNRQSATSIAADFVQVVYVNVQLTQTEADQFVQVATFVQLAQILGLECNESLCKMSIDKCAAVWYNGISGRDGPPRPAHKNRPHFCEALSYSQSESQNSLS